MFLKFGAALFKRDNIARVYIYDTEVTIYLDNSVSDIPHTIDKADEEALYTASRYFFETFLPSVGMCMDVEKVYASKDRFEAELEKQKARMQEINAVLDETTKSPQPPPQQMSYTLTQPAALGAKVSNPQGLTLVPRDKG